MSAICARSKRVFCIAIEVRKAEKESVTMSVIPQIPSSVGFTSNFGPFAPAVDYMVDAAQRSVLFWDVMRQRGNQYCEHLAQTAPHVLDYEVELVVDGRQFDRPVNYALVRIVPPQGVEIDSARRPFVVVDPRAGHGPGIGGFKADSEIGVALKAGHPCYFVGCLGDLLRRLGGGDAIAQVLQAGHGRLSPSPTSRNAPRSRASAKSPLNRISSRISGVWLRSSESRPCSNARTRLTGIGSR